MATYHTYTTFIPYMAIILPLAIGPDAALNGAELDTLLPSLVPHRSSGFYRDVLPPVTWVVGALPSLG